MPSSTSFGLEKSGETLRADLETPDTTAVCPPGVWLHLHRNTDDTVRLTKEAKLKKGAVTQPAPAGHTG